VALRKELDSLQPGVREDILWERWTKLSDEEMGATHYMCIQDQQSGDPTISAIIALLDKRLPAWRTELLPKREAMLTQDENRLLATPKRNRQDDEHAAAERIEGEIFKVAGRVRERMMINDLDVVRRITGPDRSKAGQLADRIAKSERMATIIQNYRQIVNFEHWRRRAEVEQSAAALAARSSAFEGKQALAEGRLPEAADAFAEGMRKWRELFEDSGFDNLADDDSIAETVMESIQDYVKVLEQQDDLFPDDFPLGDFVLQRVEKESSGVLRMAREATAAREKALAEGDLDAALAECEGGLKMWQDLLGRFPALTLMASKEAGQEIFDTINRYGDVLRQRHEPFPDNFPLLDFLHLHIEQAEETLKARNAITEGNLLLSESKFPAAQEAYDRGLAEWRKLLDKFPVLLSGADKAVAGELTQAVEGYGKILELRGKQFPEDFILRDVREMMRPAN
jgi:tetratricopeptide (TPR) repeat protein